MYDSLLRGVIERFADLKEELNLFTQLTSSVLDVLINRPSMQQQFHRNVPAFLILSGAVNCANIRVTQASQRRGFALEPNSMLVIPSTARYFERYVSRGLSLLDQIDRPQAAAPYEGLELEAVNATWDSIVARGLPSG